MKFHSWGKKQQQQRQEVVSFSHWVTSCQIPLCDFVQVNLHLHDHVGCVSFPLTSMHRVLLLHNWLVSEISWRKQPRKCVVAEAQGELQRSGIKTYHKDDNMCLQSAEKKIIKNM